MRRANHDEYLLRRPVTLPGPLASSKVFLGDLNRYVSLGSSFLACRPDYPG